MARINVEDGIESRLEYRKLLKLVQFDDDKALGMLVRFWRLAQRYWGEGKLVPLQEIEDWEFQPIIESKWGIIKPEGVYAIGSEERFAWYRQKCEAGKKGGRPKKEDPAPDSSDNAEPSEQEPEETGEKPEITESNREKPAKTGTEPPINSENPLILSPVPILSLEKENIYAVAQSAPASEIVPKRSKFSESTREKMRAFVATYAEAYKKKYQFAPECIRDKALIGKLGHWIEHVSEVRAISLVEVFLQISYKPFDENYHDLWQFFRHLNRIGIALDTGKDSNTTDWSKVFARVG